MSNSVRLLIACRVFIVSYWEVFWKMGVLKKQLVYKTVSFISGQSSWYTCEEVHFLYNITNFTRKLTALRVWRIFITVFEKAIFENAYWSIQYMYSYMWCVFRFDTICFIKKRQNHHWKGVIFEVSCERSQIAKHITYRLYI